jgi:2-iminobutanoate/2-iminopropanoate deaminase
VAPPYSPVVRAGEFLICSGQLGQVEGQLADGITAQVNQAMRNISNLLAAHDSGLHDVVKVTVLLADINDYAAMNEAYVSHFSGQLPARTAFAAGGLPLGALVEIEAWAHRPATERL